MGLRAPRPGRGRPLPPRLALISAPRCTRLGATYGQHLLDNTGPAPVHREAEPEAWGLEPAACCWLAGQAATLTEDVRSSDTPSILLVQDYFILNSVFTFLLNKYHLLFTNYVLNKHIYNFRAMHISGSWQVLIF